MTRLVKSVTWICLFLLLISNASADLNDGLVGYWPLDDLDASDASGHGLDGIVNGFIETTEDRFGNEVGAMLFTGVASDFVDLGDDDAFQISESMTLAAWVMLDGGNTNNGRIIAKMGGGGRRSWSLNIEAGNFDPTFQISTDGGNVISVRDLDELPSDEWAHMVGVYRPGQQTEIYVNAELKGIEEFDIPDEQYSENGLPVLIGSRNACGNCGWVGAIDDVAIWNRDLSDEEVLSLFENGIGGPQVIGDFNGNGSLDAEDLDLLSQGQKANDPRFDLNGDNKTDLDDRIAWVDDLKKTWIGDSNLDDEFNSGDLVQIFQEGKFETQQMATWEQGDWNGDMVFDSGDLVLAFQAGGFEMGPRPTVNSVPEPSAFFFVLMSFTISVHVARQKNLTPPKK